MVNMITIGHMDRNRTKVSSAARDNLSDLSAEKFLFGSCYISCYCSEL